jgi:hypothetical protein
MTVAAIAVIVIMTVSAVAPALLAVANMKPTLTPLYATIVNANDLTEIPDETDPKRSVAHGTVTEDLVVIVVRTKDLVSSREMIVAEMQERATVGIGDVARLLPKRKNPLPI